MDRRSRQLAWLVTSLVVVACGDHDSILNQIHQHNNGYTESFGDDSDSLTTTSSSSTTFATSVGTGGSSTTTQDEPTTSGEATEVAIELDASGAALTQAGSVVLYANVTGPVTSLDLKVTAGALEEQFSWPVGQASWEHIVDSPTQNGTITFELTAMGADHQLARDTVEVEISLPPSGTIEARVVGLDHAIGKAAAVVTRDGLTRDEVVVVGNNWDGEILLSRFDGQLSTAVIDTQNPLDVRGAAVYPDGTVVVVGQTPGDNMSVRRYEQYGDAWLYRWDKTIQNAAAHDLALGPDGHIYIAGTKNWPERVDAAAWVLNGSGGINISGTYEAKDIENGPLDSAAYAVAFDGDKAIWAGESGVVVDIVSAERAALFSLTADNLDRFVTQELSTPPEHSGWRSLVKTTLGYTAIGWYLHENVPTAQTMMRSRYGPDWVEHDASTSVDRVGHVVDWHPGEFVVWGGAVVDNGHEHFSFQSDVWAPYIDPERGTVHDLVIDRHGYSYFIGELHVDGLPRTILVSVHP